MVDIQDPIIFAGLMRKWSNGDEEISHIEMDELMVMLLRSLGYGEAMDIFEAQGKWYS